MKLRNRIGISLVPLVIILAAFYWYISSNWSEFQSLELSNPIYFIPAVLFVALNVFSIGALLELAIEPHGTKLSNKEIFGLSSLTRFSNQISPGYLGAVVRASYLKKNYNISYSKFSSSFLLSNILQFVISGFAALAVYVFYSADNAESKPIVLILVTVAVLMLMLYAPTKKLSQAIERLSRKRKSKVLERLADALNQFDKVRRHPNLFLRSLGWMIVTLLSSSVILLSLYMALGYNINFAAALFIASLASWTIVFSITPASIGIREGLMVIGARIMGVPIPLTISVAIILRIVTFTTVGALSFYFAPRLLNKTIFNIKSIKEN